MPLYKDDLYDILLKSGKKAGFCVTGEKYFRDKTGVKAFAPIHGVWPCGTEKKGNLIASG